ncbi:MAG: NUDIX hydrolase [Candidatus Bathyarchaeia archaeon]
MAAVVFGDASVLLVKRGNEPSQGMWGLPGGVVELGETVEEAVVREVREETGLEVRPVRLLAVFDSIVRDGEGRVRFHYVLCEHLCEVVGGALQASSDALGARWVPLSSLGSLDMNPGTRRFIRKVWSTARGGPSGSLTRQDAHSPEFLGNVA